MGYLSYLGILVSVSVNKAVSKAEVFQPLHRGFSCCGSRLTGFHFLSQTQKHYRVGVFFVILLLLNGDERCQLGVLFMSRVVRRKDYG